MCEGLEWEPVPDELFCSLRPSLSLLSFRSQAEREGACDCLQQIIAPNSEQLLHPPQRGDSGDVWSCSLFTLQFRGLFNGTVLVEQLQHFLFVFENFHHGVSGLGHLVHHKLTALHVTLRTNTQTHNQKRSYWRKSAGWVEHCLEWIQQGLWDFERPNWHQTFRCGALPGIHVEDFFFLRAI